MKIGSEEELVDVLRGAREPLRVIGGGGRGMTGPGEPLDVTGVTGVRLYEPEALTLVVAAGTTLSEVEALLARQGQRLAFEPADWRGLLGTGGAPTVGGMVAANIAGPRRVQAGGCRDALLGVRFVDGTGALVKSGGRVMKNVTGYDLARLMAGSYGTLGVLTEVALKVLPEPEATLTIRVAGLDPARGVAAMNRALASPYEVTGAVWVPKGEVAIRIEGFAGSVAYRAGRLSDLLRDFGAVSVDDDGAFWRAVRDVAVFHEAPGDVWRFSLKPSAAPEVVARLNGPVMLDWGGGLIWALVPEGTDARAVAAPYGGHATLIRAAAETRARIARFESEPPAVAALTAGLRGKFDPKGILNPGLMG